MDSTQLEGLPSRISNAAAGVVTKRLGPGPTRIRAVVDGRTIVILFSDGLTKGERRQIVRGNGHHVLAAREEFQRLMRDDLVAMVQDLSSRSVISFLAHTHLDPDVSIVVCMLESASPRQSAGAGPDGVYRLDPRPRAGRHLRAVPPVGAQRSSSRAFGPSPR